MKKIKSYMLVRFTVEVLRESLVRLSESTKTKPNDLRYLTLSVRGKDVEWHYDTPDEFFSDYRGLRGEASFHIMAGNYSLVVWVFDEYSRVQVEGESRQNVESVFEVFEASAEKCKLPEPERKIKTPVIFIGHGRSQQWRDLKDHLQEKHGYKVEAYESGARAGHTIRDILEDMAAKSSFAVLVMTSEDEQPDGNFRARQNVIHEAGLFQGKLGFPRAIVLLEDGVEEFSNVAGVQYIRFSKGNIKETYGEVLATLRREFMC